MRVRSHREPAGRHSATHGEGPLRRKADGGSFALFKLLRHVALGVAVFVSALLDWKPYVPL